MAFPVINPILQFFDNSGEPLSGGLLYTYAPGTTTPKTTYTDENLSVPNANPIVLDSGGRCVIFLTDGEEYKFVLQTSAGVTLKTVDEVKSPTGLTASSIGQIIFPRTSGEISAGVTPSDYSYPAGDIRRYGASTAASAATNTTAIQAAVDSSYSVYVPAGTYSTNTITLRTGSHLYGDGHLSILQQNTITDGSYGTVYANSLSSSSQVTDIIIEKIQVLGKVDTLSFSEFQHLVSLNGVARVIIRDCLVKGFRGDGIYLGSGVAAGQERHNTNVKIVNCTIDGVNKDNRNGISIIDGEDILIDGNTLIRCSRSNMPGAVDIEPDSNAFHIVRDIKIVNNHFDDCGGNVACIGLVLGGTTFTTQPENFLVQGNSFRVSSRGFAINNDVSSYARPFNFQFKDNNGLVSDPWTISSYARGLDISGNTFRFTGDAVLGEDVTDQVVQCEVNDNILTGDGVTTGVVVRSGNAINIDNNTLSNFAGYGILVGGVGATLSELGITNNTCTSSVQYGVEFGGGTVTNVRIIDNDFSRVSGSAFNGTIPTDTRIRNNKGYLSENGGVTGAIATGATVTHGLGNTPNNVSVTALDSGPTDIYVSAIGGTTFTINYGGGGTHVFSWEAKLTHFYVS